MAQEPVRRFLRPVGNPADPDGLFQWMQRYLAHIRAKSYTRQTQWHHERYLRDFIGWCDARRLAAPRQIRRQVLEDYLLFLQHYRTRQGEPLQWLSKQNKLIPVRSFFRWLAHAGHLPADPAADLSQGRPPMRLHAQTLKPAEVAHLMAQPDVGAPLGIRDRAMLETLFSTGIRRMELAALQVQDVDRQAATLFVRQGKGRKDRVIPIGPAALHWIDRYVRQVRRLRAAPGQSTLFLTGAGGPFHLGWLGTVIGGYVKRAFPQRSGACHLLRHTMATLMLEDGADIRYVQAMLGHAQLTSTQIYTEVSIAGLKAVHARTAPGARAGRHPAPRRGRTAGTVFRRHAHALVDRLPAGAGWLELLQSIAAAALAEGNPPRPAGAGGGGRRSAGPLAGMTPGWYTSQYATMLCL